jgi:hypothetical protein
MGEKHDLAQVAAPAGLGRRADQPGSLGVVLPRRRRGPLPDRRHLVADRNRRHADHAAARRHRPEARLGHAAVLRRQAGARRRRQGAAGRRRGQSVHRRQLAGARCAPSMATTSASSRPISAAPTRASTSPATAAAATRTAITGSPAASTTSSTSPATAWARPRSKRAGRPSKVAEAAVVGYPHDIKGQGIYAYVTLMAGASRPTICARNWWRLGPQGDRPDRLARPDPVGARPAEDPLGQDHAPHPAQDRRERLRRRLATPRRWPIQRPASGPKPATRFPTKSMQALPAGPSQSMFTITARQKPTAATQASRA